MKDFLILIPIELRSSIGRSRDISDINLKFELTTRQMTSLAFLNGGIEELHLLVYPLLFVADVVSSSYKEDIEQFNTITIIPTVSIDYKPRVIDKIHNNSRISLSQHINL